MLVDNLVSQLASLSLDVGRVPQEKASKKLEYKDKGMMFRHPPAGNPNRHFLNRPRLYKYSAQGFAVLSTCCALLLQQATVLLLSITSRRCLGEHAIKQLEAHLARVRIQVSQPHSLGDAAKQEGKGLLKIAQAGLRNTAGGLGEFCGCCASCSSCSLATPSRGYSLVGAETAGKLVDCGSKGMPACSRRTPAVFRERENTALFRFVSG